MTDITLLICTYNRAASLERTLQSITRAAIDAPLIEVIIVDNGSTDDTSARLQSWRSSQTFPVRIIVETRAGLASARNAGLARAKGRIIAMTDDDCVLDPGFFTFLRARFDAVSAPVVIGGRILLGDSRDLPVTIKTEDHSMAADPDGFPGGFVMGANLAFTRDVLERVGNFDERFGAGAPFRAAEDTDFLFRALGCGIPVLYDPHFVVAHHHGRRSGQELRTVLAGYAFGDGAVYAKHAFRDGRVSRAITNDIRQLIAEYRSEKCPLALIPSFYRFRFIEVIRGFAAFYRSRLSKYLRVENL